MSAWAFIASSGAHGAKVTSGSTATATVGAAVKWGDRVVVLIGLHDSVSNTVSSVTDSLGNVYTQDATTNFGAGVVYGTIYSTPVTVAGTPVVTANFTALTSGAAVVGVAAYSGTALKRAVDITKTATGTSTNATTGASTVATTGSNELVIGGFFDDGGGDPTVAAGAGFTARTSLVNDATVEILLEDKTSTTPATQTATTVNAADNWGVMCVVYRLSSSRLPSPVIRPHAFSPGLAR